MTGATCGEGDDHSSGTPDITFGFCEDWNSTLRILAMDRDTRHNVSLSLARIMDRKIGTRESVEVQRFVDKIIHQTIPKYPYEVLQSGSRGEGMYLPGSDDDLMFIDRNVIVLGPDEPVNICRHPNQTILRFRYDGCRPGFVTLQLVRQPQIHLDSCIANSLTYTCDGVLCISSERFKEMRVNGLEGSIQHGPCATIESTQHEIDFAYCFHRQSWPSEVSEMGGRSHQNECWPSPELIRVIKQHGCHVVPIGDPYSNTKDLQWRLSFSLAEKALVQSLTHAQFRVYGILKVFLKEAINTNVSINGLLCSYFVKTVVFFAVQKSPRTLWKQEYTLLCFWLCFNMLIDWVRVGDCPNFFIPQNNMFYGKISGETKQRLLRRLLEYRRMGWMCLCQCETFSNIAPRQETLRILTSETERLIDFAYKRVTSLDITEIRPTFLRRVIWLKLYSKSLVKQSIGDTLYRQLLLHKGKSLFSNYGTGNNKRIYSLLRKSKELLSVNYRCTDAAGPLLLATYHYQTGNYRRALQQCQVVESSYQPYTLMSNILEYDESRVKCYEENVCGLGLSVTERMQIGWMGHTKFKRGEERFCPVEIHPELALNPIQIPPLPYAAFLSVLCCKNMGDTRGTDQALRNLQELVRGTEHNTHWIVLSLLGICYQALGDYRRAVQWYEVSLSMDELFNPAGNRIIKLLDLL